MLGLVKGEDMSLLMGHLCCCVQQHVLPCASVRQLHSVFEGAVTVPSRYELWSLGLWHRMS